VENIHLVTGTKPTGVDDCALFFFGIKSKTGAKNTSFSFLHRRQRIPAAREPFTMRGNIIIQSAIENLDLGPDPNTP